MVREIFAVNVTKFGQTATLADKNNYIGTLWKLPDWKYREKETQLASGLAHVSTVAVEK